MDRKKKNSKICKLSVLQFFKALRNRLVKILTKFERQFAFSVDSKGLEELKYWPYNFFEILKKIYTSPRDF